MGHRMGEGLGKHGQGIKVPIEESSQKGRRGLGFTLPTLDVASSKFNPEMEVVSVEEEVEWFPTQINAPPPLYELDSWLKIGPKKLVIDDEIQFCDPSVLQNVLSSKVRILF